MWTGLKKRLISGKEIRPEKGKALSNSEIGHQLLKGKLLNHNSTILFRRFPIAFGGENRSLKVLKLTEDVC